MTKKGLTEEQQWRMENYSTKIDQHFNCEGGPYLGGDLWKHVDKCESQIPEPKLRLTKKNK